MKFISNPNLVRRQMAKVLGHYVGIIDFSHFYIPLSLLRGEITFALMIDHFSTNEHLIVQSNKNPRGRLFEHMENYLFKF